MDLSENAELDALVTQAQAGDVSSMLTLSQRYLDGNGVTRNDAEAFKWAKLAAENGSSKGYRLMQKAHEEGYGAEKSADKALDCKINAEVIEGKLFSLRQNSPEKAVISVVNGLVFITGKVTYVGNGIDIGDRHLDQKFKVGDLKEWSKSLMDEATVTLVVVPEDLTKTYNFFSASGSYIESVVLNSQNKFFISSSLTPKRYLRYLLGYPLLLAWNLTWVGPLFFSFLWVIAKGGFNPFGFGFVSDMRAKDKVYNRLRAAVDPHFKAGEKLTNIEYSINSPLLKVVKTVIVSAILVFAVLFAGILYIRSVSPSEAWRILNIIGLLIS